MSGLSKVRMPTAQRPPPTFVRPSKIPPAFQAPLTRAQRRAHALSPAPVRRSRPVVCRFPALPNDAPRTAKLPALASAVPTTYGAR
eukprot:4725329-Pyramimonas_sp.AAC.1